MYVGLSQTLKITYQWLYENVQFFFPLWEVPDRVQNWIEMMHLQESVVACDLKKMNQMTTWKMSRLKNLNPWMAADEPTQAGRDFSSGHHTQSAAQAAAAADAGP